MKLSYVKGRSKVSVHVWATGDRVKQSCTDLKLILMVEIMMSAPVTK